MKFLITGVKGQLGHALVSCLTHQGADFTAYSHAELDITQRAEVERVVRCDQPDVLINAAAYTAVDQAESESLRTYEVNVTAVEHLARICQALNILLVQISTDYVFSGHKTNAYLETDETEPLSVYGKTKLMAETVARQNSRHLIIRSAWVFSEHEHNFVKTILKAAGERSLLRVVDDQIGSPTSAADLAHAIIQLSTMEVSGKLAAGCYHYAGSSCVSWYEFASRIVNKAVEIGLLAKAPVIKPILSSEYPVVAIRPKFSVLDCSKVNGLGIETVELDSALLKVLSKLK